MKIPWQVQDIPDQTGRRAIVTGANSGIGYPTALELARAGATVVLACRSRERGEAAVARLRAEVPGAKVELGILDLASLDSVRAFADHELERGVGLDLLINNAGLIGGPKRMETADGFELHFGTNVLGPFALTGLLLPALELAAIRSVGRIGGRALPQTPRVVMLASIAHKRGRLNFDDLQATRRYHAMESYQQSKLADLMLAFELDRRLNATGSKVMANAAHPGVAKTNIFVAGEYSAVEKAVRQGLSHMVGTLLNSDADGALPTLYAAVAPGAVGGGYYGPQGFAEARGGDVGDAKVAPQARDEAAAARLWSICMELTGVRYFSDQLP